jgi:antitoxin HigA-1
MVAETSGMDRMKTPSHPGELLGDTLEELSLSISAAAEGLGVTRQQLHNVISGRSGVTAEMAVRLEKAIGSTADTWLKLQMAYDLAEVRKRAINVKRLVPA